MNTFNKIMGVAVTIVISIIVLVVVGLIVFSSMKYNGSNFVWDLTRINEDVGVFAETSINDVLLDFGFTNREIRKMFESLNLKIYNLKRISIGELELGNLELGKFKYLNEVEKDMVFMGD